MNSLQSAIFLRNVDGIINADLLYLESVACYSPKNKLLLVKQKFSFISSSSVANVLVHRGSFIAT